MHRDGSRRTARRRLALLLSLALCAAVAGDGGGGGSGGDHGDSPTAAHDAPAQLPTPHLHAPGGGDGGAPAKEWPAEGENDETRESAPEDKPSGVPLHNPHVHTPVSPVDAGSGNGPDRPFVIEEVNVNDHALVAYSVPEDQVATRTHSHTHTVMEP